MSPIDYIEKLITEHGSAAILSQQLAFARDQFTSLERKVADLQTQVGRLDAQLERERTDLKQACEELQRLKDEHAEEVVIHRGVEFRRGKRTRGQWDSFCPKCHLPVVATEDCSASCNGCQWFSDVQRDELARILGML